MHHVIFLARRKSRVEIRSSELHVLTASSGGKAKGAGLLQPGPANAACSWRPLRGSELRLYPTTGFSVQRQSSRNAEPVRCFRSRSFKFRWEHSPAWAAHPTGDLTLNGSASFSRISVAGSSGNHRLHLYVYFFPVRDETEPPVKNWSILLRPQKATRLQKWQRSKRLRRAAIRALRGPRRNMKASANDKMASTRIDCRALCMNKEAYDE